VKETFADLNTGSTEVTAADLGLLSDPSELDLIKKLAFYPVMIAGAARERAPHKVAFYLYDLAQSFHGHWARGNESPHLRYIQSDNRALTAARLALVAAHAQVLASGLAILGVGAPEELR
jgi:arginyl-tRNA synthetase